MFSLCLVIFASVASTASSSGVLSKYNLKNGVNFQGTSFGHFRAYFVVRKPERVRIVLCECPNSYEDNGDGLKATIAFAAAPSDAVATSKAEDKDLESSQQRTDESSPRPLTSLEPTTNDRPRANQKAATTTSKSENSAQTFGGDDDKQKQKDSENENSEYEGRRPTAPVHGNSESRRRRKRGALYRCSTIAARKTIKKALSRFCNGKIVLAQDCTSTIAGQYKINIKGFGNFEILAAVATETGNS